MGSLLDAVAGWSLFLSLVGVVGAVAGRWVLLRPSPAGGPLGDLRAEAARFGRLSAVVCLAALGLVFARQLVEFHDPFVSWGEDARLLLGGTAWGTAWGLAVGAAAALLVGFTLAASGAAWIWVPATVIALALGAFPAFTGHANAGDLRRYTLVADVVHVWAAGCWVGGLGLVLWLERARRRGGAESALPLLVPRFSPMAMASVAALAATGLFASWVHLGGLDGLLTTPYGRLLTLKLLLVFVVLGLGARNFRSLSPRLDAAAGRSAMRRSAGAELLVANLVLVITALLVRTPPP